MLLRGNECVIDVLGSCYLDAQTRRRCTRLAGSGRGKAARFLFDRPASCQRAQYLVGKEWQENLVCWASRRHALPSEDLTGLWQQVPADERGQQCAKPCEISWAS